MGVVTLLSSVDTATDEEFEVVEEDRATLDRSLDEIAKQSSAQRVAKAQGILGALELLLHHNINLIIPKHICTGMYMYLHHPKYSCTCALCFKLYSVDDL